MCVLENTHSYTYTSNIYAHQHFPLVGLEPTTSNVDGKTATATPTLVL